MNYAKMFFLSKLNPFIHNQILIEIALPFVLREFRFGNVVVFLKLYHALTSGMFSVINPHIHFREVLPKLFYTMLLVLPKFGWINGSVHRKNELISYSFSFQNEFLFL